MFACVGVCVCVRTCERYSFCHSSCRDLMLLPSNMLPLLSLTEGDETGVMDSLMEALQSGAAFRDRRKRTPRNGTVTQTKSSLLNMWHQPLESAQRWFRPWYRSLHTSLCSSLILIPYFCLCLVKPPVSWLGLDLMTCFCCLCCFIAIITAGDQSPSSPASRWPGANYGNRTLGACLSGPDALVLHFCWLR